MPETAPENAARPRRGPAVVGGVLSVAVGLGVAELVAGLLPDQRSLVLGIGDVVIDSVPGWLERAAIATLGTADKPVLVTSIVVVALALGALAGLLAARRFALAAALYAAVVVLGMAAAASDPRGSVVAVLLTGVLAAAAGIATLAVLVRGPGRQAGPAHDRRRFLGLAGAAAAVAAGSAAAGRALATAGDAAMVALGIDLPEPDRPAPPVPDGADLEIAGLTPLFVANEDFYRIDTALTVPRVDPADWSLSVTGMVDEPFTLTYDELLALPQIEADITLTCVSNEVGGGLVGNARWQGTPLRGLLERAGVQAGATQVLGRSVDGFTAGFPTLTALDLDQAMVAVGMNGEPLPALHGFPARLVVPGLYGYVSATKWLSSIELTSFEDVEGYWIPRGWAREGPIKTQSRIDVPRPGSRVPAGEAVVAGVAWAPTRGIERVEVSIDDGPWQEATLAERLDVDCWRQWFLPWSAEAGQHVIAVRATDGAGEVQTDERTPVAPDGASGRHTVQVDVDGTAG